MNIDDFYNNDPAPHRKQWLRHKTLPIVLWTSINGACKEWYYWQFNNEIDWYLESFLPIRELENKKIEDVPEEYINLLLLKYSIL